MKKEDVIDFAKEHKKQLIIIAACLVLSILLQLLKIPFLSGLGVLLTWATVIYAAVFVYMIFQKRKAAAAEKAKEEAKAKAQKAIEDFKATVDIPAELDYIFSVLEKSGATASNFEKGLEHFFSKTETPLTKEQILPMMKEALFARAFGSDDYAIAKVVAVDYFIQDVVKGEMLTQYMRFAIARAKYPTAEMIEPFVKALYGVAGRAFNYQYNSEGAESYQALTPDAFKLIIENSEVLQSYTDEDPFAKDTVREKWANDMYTTPLNMVRSSQMGNALDNEKYLDEMCYLAYTVLREEQESDGENASIAAIAVAYSDFLKAIYDKISQ